MRIYIGFTILGLIISLVGLLGAVVGNKQEAEIIGLLLILAYGAVIRFLVLKSKKGLGREYAYVLVLPMPLVILVHALFLIFSNLVSTYILN